MLPKAQRVTSKLFEDIIQYGITYHTEHLSLKTRKTAAQHSRFSVAVPKKVYKRAVDRNKEKRRLYVSLSELTHEVPKNLIGVFFVKKGFAALSSLEIKQEGALLLKKAFNIPLS